VSLPKFCDFNPGPSLRRSLAVTTVALAGVLPAVAAFADGVADFYSGKSVKLIVSSSAGGGYDTYARLISRHMGAKI
jgi:tripartite-type tricarboxylate transporter receptor subunit TctC